MMDRVTHIREAKIVAELHRYASSRREAIKAIERVAGKNAVVPLEAVSCLLPDHPEWSRYRRHPARRHLGER